MTAEVVALVSVSRAYTGPVSVDALRSVSLSVHRGEFVAICGPSGAGKSTLLNILGLLDQPTSGQYLLDGRDVTNATDQERTRLRASTIGFVFQSWELLPHYTAVENTELGVLYRGMTRRERHLRAVEALERVGLVDRAPSLPRELSGGQQQRVAIARALATNPKLLLCDEPTGQLDSETTSEIVSLLREISDHGETVLVVTHDPLVARAADRIVDLVDGRLSKVSSRR
jgi:putative ABC transport system ATP-binding protein